MPDDDREDPGHDFSADEELAAAEEELAAAEEAARLAREFHDRFLIKTTIRCVIWFLIAAGIAYFLPEQAWVWYVAAAFIIIAIVVAIGSIVLKLVTERRLRNLIRG